MSLRSLLSATRAMLAGIAPATSIKTDDAAVVMIDAILNDAELFGWFERKVAESDANGGALSMEGETAPVALQMVLEQRQIAWLSLLQSLPAIIAAINALKALKG